MTESLNATGNESKVGQGKGLLRSGEYFRQQLDN